MSAGDALAGPRDTGPGLWECLNSGDVGLFPANQALKTVEKTVELIRQRVFNHLFK